jgi:hypothetical protein
MTVGQGVSRGMQDMRTPLAITLGANAINLGLDALLILRLDWGVSGAAVATTTAEWAAALAYLGMLWHRRSVLGLGSSSPARMLAGAAATTEAFLPFARAGGAVIMRTALLLGTKTLASATAARLGAESMAAHQIVMQVGGERLGAGVLGGRVAARCLGGRVAARCLGGRVAARCLGGGLRPGVVHASSLLCRVPFTITPTMHGGCLSTHGNGAPVPCRYPPFPSLQLWLFSSLVIDSLAIAGQSLVAVHLGGGDVRTARSVSVSVFGGGGWVGGCVCASVRPCVRLHMLFVVVLGSHCSPTAHGNCCSPPTPSSTSPPPPKSHAPLPSFADPPPPAGHGNGRCPRRRSCPRLPPPPRPLHQQ